MILRLLLNLPDDSAYVPITRHLTHTLLEHLQVVDSDVADIECVLGELAANVIDHAGTDRYQLDVEFHADRVVVTVTDEGRGLAFADLPEPSALAIEDSELVISFAESEELQTRGWGLKMVQQISDRLQFTRTDPHGTTVRAEKYLSYQSFNAAADASEMDHDTAGIRITDS